MMEQRASPDSKACCSGAPKGWEEPKVEARKLYNRFWIYPRSREQGRTGSSGRQWGLKFAVEDLPGQSLRQRQRSAV